MLMLYRIIDYGEFKRCDISGEPIGYGDFYYEDTEDGTIVKATIYKKLKDEKNEKNFDYSLLNQAQSEKEYKENLKKVKADFLRETILDRPIAEKGMIRNDNANNSQKYSE